MLIDKKTDLPLLPPGSFYLPAVSRNADRYFSDTERAIYIPLHRPDQLIQPFPIRTNVVLVNKQQTRAAPPVLHVSKEGEEEEDEEQDRDGEEEEEDTEAINEEEEEEEEDNEEDPNLGSIREPAVTPPTKTHSGALDLVMTLYPNLPKLVSPSHFNSQAMKNLLKFNKTPVTANSGSAGFIHEAKVVTPPKGYLPQLSPKPTPKPAIFHSKPPPSGNTLVTQLKSPNIYAPDQRHHPTASTSGISNTIQFTPFTPDDISPLNFLLPPASSSLEQVTATDQPETRSNYIVGPNGDLAANSSSASQNPLKVIPAPKFDFSWNLYHPSPISEVSHQQSNGSELVHLLVLDGERQAEKSKSQRDSVRKPESLNELHVVGETREIVVRSKMATSGSESGNHVNRPGFIDSVDIVTGFYEDVTTTTKNDILLAAGQNASSRFVSSTTEPPTGNQETPSTPSSIINVTNSSSSRTTVEEAATTTTPANVQIDDVVKSSVPTPKLFGDFQPSMFGRFPHHHLVPQHRPHQSNLVPKVPKVPLHPPAIHVVHDANEDVFSATRLPNIAEDSHVAGSQIHESSVYEENLPRIHPIKPLDTQGKSSTAHYKKGKMSPKGAMYTVTQGHSKVKFFGFNALHNGELRSVDGKYILVQQKEPDWKSNPYIPVRISTTTHQTIKHIPKKSIPISSRRKSTSRSTEFSPKKPNADPPSRSPSLIV